MRIQQNQDTSEVGRTNTNNTFIAGQGKSSSMFIGKSKPKKIRRNTKLESNTHRNFYIVGSNLTFDGNNKTISFSKTNDQSSGIELDNKAKNITIKNCKIEGFSMGIAVRRNTNITIENNDIQSCKRDGIDVNSSNNCKFINNSLKNNKSNGIELDYSKNCEISGNTLSGNEDGIDLDKCSNLKICNNKSTSNTRDGVRVDQFSKNNYIDGNTIENNTRNGLRISDGSVQNTVVNNTIKNNGTNISILKGLEDINTVVE